MNTCRIHQDLLKLYHLELPGKVSELSWSPRTVLCMHDAVLCGMCYMLQVRSKFIASGQLDAHGCEKTEGH